MLHPHMQSFHNNGCLFGPILKNVYINQIQPNEKLTTLSNCLDYHIIIMACFIISVCVSHTAVIDQVYASL